MSKEAKSILYSFIPGIIILLFLWAIKFYEWNSGSSFANYGVFPRTVSGLKGIIASPFIHGDFKHLISNSIPLLILSAALFYFYKRLAFRGFFWVYFLGGFWLWLGGRYAFHIGASGVVYGLTTFIFLSGVLRRDTRLMAISLLVVFLYGGMVWGIFPLIREVSWEAHLFGALAGLLLAVVYRNEGPQRKLFEWEKYSYEEEEDEEEDEENAYWKLPQENSVKKDGGAINIRYFYRPANNDTESNQDKNNNEQN